MWLDAFIPKNKNMQNIGVTGVTGVTPPRKASIHAGFSKNAACDTEENQGVTGVTTPKPVTPVTPCDTYEKSQCHSDITGKTPSKYMDLAEPVTPVTPVTPQKHMKPEIIDTLALFQFELMEQDLAAGHTAEQLRRVNNITWRLMTAKGFTFDEAIKAAAEWVIDNEQRQDETAFVDVLALYSGLHQPANKESTP
jgi:hypothetical protein